MEKFTKLAYLIVIAICVGTCSTDPPEVKAIKIAKKSYALVDNVTVEDEIKNWLYEKGDQVKPKGWEATKIGKRLYLAKCKYPQTSRADISLFLKIRVAVVSSACKAQWMMMM